MTTRPLVSVIVPAYNYGHFLAETLASVQAQTLADWECIVVDDGSTDDTWEVALAHARRDERIKYLRRGNGGLAAARNSGLRAASGAYVQLLDADDLIEPRKLQAQVAHLERHAGVGIVYGDCRYFDSDTGERRRALFGPDVDWMPRTSGSGDELLGALVRANIMVVNAPLVRRSVIDEVGWFAEELTSLEDWQYWLRSALAGARFDFLDAAETLSLVRVHRRSMSQNRLQMHEQQVAIRKALGAAMGDAARRANRLSLSEELGMLGQTMVAQGDRLRGAHYFLEAGWTNPASGRRWLKQVVRALLPFGS